MSKEKVEKPKVEDPVVTTQEIIEINDMHHMVTILTRWHAKKVATLEHMREIPDGTVMVDVEDNKITMEGKFLEGFKAGLQISLIELGTLPFTITPDVKPIDVDTKE